MNTKKINLDLGLKMYPYPSIEQFRNVIYNVNRKSTFVGLDEQGEPILDETKSKPTLSFIGTTKLHGTNASVVFDLKNDVIYYQSRENVICPTKDNAGFASYMASIQNEFYEFIMSKIERNNNDVVCVYGEWCGCFYYDTPILLADGTKRKIGEIVKNKLQLEVLCYNKNTNQLEKKKIINWYNNGVTDNWLTIDIARRKRGGKSTRLIVTPNHIMFVKRNGLMQEIPASELLLNDVVFTVGTNVPYMVEQFLKGTIIGDGSFIANSGMKISHSNINQPFYNEFLQKLLGHISTYKIDKSSGFTTNDTGSFSVQSLPVIKEIREEILCDNRKSITKKYLQSLHPPALAAWYMDDGSIIQNTNGGRQFQCELATCGFTKNENETIAEHFCSYGYECYLSMYNEEKQQFNIRFSINGAKAFLATIAPYIIEGFNYKLPENLQKINKYDWFIGINEYDTALIPTFVKSIKKENKYIEKHKRIRYDIEIENNNNYFANNILVHNSNIQKGVALNGLEKMFVIFDVRLIKLNEDINKIERMWLSPNKISGLQLAHHDLRIYNIYDFETWKIDIDFNYPQLKQNELVEITKKIEAMCPVGKFFGNEGVGEGAVWKSITEPFTNDSGYWMKVKGEKHSSSKVKTIASVNIERLNNIKEFIELAVTDNRCAQSIDKLKEAGLPLLRTSLPEYLRWIHGDIMKEEMDTILANGFEPKELVSHISSKAREWFFRNEINF